MADDRKQSNTSTNSNSNSPTAQQFPQQGTAKLEQAGPSSPTSDLAPTGSRDRRDSAEWDASKVPPSRFQKRKGSIYAVPHSRDGKIDRNYPSKYFEKLAEMGYAKK
ncbi:hypothetical protein C8A01DRAFT_33073 [Parachaetomium inaequale]|uniref:Uncharacterized protein n=1 Tax=Parachaetomium inaequale TaxID=2588326 RepID=A0AAN6PKY6_9PEZI|nr:hypothetical protein C8A01DRAFT_33073 [Parachaetomium inaequale]